MKCETENINNKSGYSIGNRRDESVWKSDIFNSDHKNLYGDSSLSIQNNFNLLMQPVQNSIGPQNQFSKNEALETIQMKNSKGYLAGLQMKPLVSGEKISMHPELNLFHFGNYKINSQNLAQKAPTGYNYLKSGDMIQRVPMPGESTVTSMGDYAASSRQGIRYEAGFDFSNVLSRYFQRGIVLDTRTGYNVTYVVRGFPSGEEWVANALKALILYNFNLNGSATEAPVLNITTVQHLDMSSQTNPADTTIHGPDAVVRFTSTRFDATGSGDTHTENVQLLVEKLSNFSTVTSTESPADRRQRFANTYRITNAVPVRNDPLGDPLEAMSDSQFDVVLEALDRIPSGILSRVTGIPIHRSLSARGTNNEVAEYNQTRAAGSTTWERKITVFGDFFRENPEQRAFTMIHEIGHALDFRPNEGAGGSGGPLASAATGRGSFRAAVQADGGVAKGVSTYAATTTSFDEYYAEAFAMYRSQPDTLKNLRPNVYQYFSTQYP